LVAGREKKTKTKETTFWDEKIEGDERHRLKKTRTLCRCPRHNRENLVGGHFSTKEPFLKKMDRGGLPVQEGKRK